MKAIPHDLQGRLYARLRKTPSPSTVWGSLPVVFFGDLFHARAATIGLNPSDKEYLNPSGEELDGDERRFQTLRSLGATDRASLTDEQCEHAVETMCSYYEEGKPVYGWFRPLDRVTRAMGLRYDQGDVAHLDLAQEATSPTWSNLRKSSPAEFAALRSNDLAFLRWELESFPLNLLICNGRTVYDEVSDLVSAKTVEEGSMKLIRWFVGKATITGRNVCVVGWNLPLTRPTGLGQAGEEELGRLLGSRCAADYNL
jgi:hypothetical protein